MSYYSTRKQGKKKKQKRQEGIFLGEKVVARNQAWKNSINTDLKLGTITFFKEISYGLGKGSMRGQKLDKVAFCNAMLKRTQQDGQDYESCGKKGQIPLS